MYRRAISNCKDSVERWEQRQNTNLLTRSKEQRHREEPSSVAKFLQMFDVGSQTANKFKEYVFFL